MYANFFFKFSKAGCILLLTLFSIQTRVTAQNFLEIPVKLEVENGDMNDIVVKVKKDGKDAFTQSGAAKMRFKLDFNKKYSLIFTKPGYITKTIELNTAAPSARISQGFEAYKIGVKLFKQSDDEKTVVYNQPVARIKYDANLDEFSFDTDYSKSILSAMASPEERKPRDRAAEAKVTPNNPNPDAGAAQPENPQPETAATPVANVEPTPAPASASTNNEPEPIQAAPVAATEPPPPAPEPAKPQIIQEENKKPSVAMVAEEPKPVQHVQSAEEPKPVQHVSSGEEISKTSRPIADAEKPAPVVKMKSGEEINKPVIKMRSSEEPPPPPIVYLEEEKITREDIVERNRVITKVKVMKGNQITEYSRVNYSWGGQYFFKNNSMSIPQNLFVQWTGVNN
ncbi:hypothetical protein BH11BAC2_BH11BAC2_15190 [soil metagenome]